MDPIRLGTRGSALARTQSGLVADALRRLGFRVELVLVRTEGDRNTGSLAQIGGTGVFVTALREALLAGSVDLAVHSLKDLPTSMAPGIALAAVPEREDPSDVLVARDGADLAGLRPGARVGTGSPRRAAQLRAARPDLEVRDIRGNVDTRLRRVLEDEAAGPDRLDAVVLARAGLARLGRLDAASQVLPPEVMLPAPGQGALAIECRAADAGLTDTLAALDHPATRIAVAAERAFLARLEAGCAAPVGTLATLDDDGPARLSLRAVAFPPTGAAVRAEGRGTATLAGATALGEHLAEDALARGFATDPPRPDHREANDG